MLAYGHHGHGIRRRPHFGTRPQNDPCAYAPYEPVLGSNGIIYPNAICVPPGVAVVGRAPFGMQGLGDTAPSASVSIPLPGIFASAAPPNPVNTFLTDGIGGVPGWILIAGAAVVVAVALGLSHEKKAVEAVAA